MHVTKQYQLFLLFSFFLHTSLFFVKFVSGLLLRKSSSVSHVLLIVWRGILFLGISVNTAP